MCVGEEGVLFKEVQPYNSCLSCIDFRFGHYIYTLYFVMAMCDFRNIDASWSLTTFVHQELNWRYVIGSYTSTIVSRYSTNDICLLLKFPSLYYFIINWLIGNFLPPLGRPRHECQLFYYTHCIKIYDIKTIEESSYTMYGIQL